MSDISSKAPTWTPEEHAVIVEFLYNIRSSSASGGNFKPADFQALANHLHMVSPKRTNVTATQVKQQWSSIKSIEKAINDYNNSSGAGGTDREQGSLIFEGADLEHFVTYRDVLCTNEMVCPGP
ncbi:hypothetical protein P691DRAFT_805413, partial [Macrolepiota fuliginosa MF-IS2]